MPKSLIDGRFELVDHNGSEVTEKSYRGRWMLVYFGFTHCRMVCPRTLKKLSDSLERVGDLSSQIAPLYITVDPERDTPEVMRAFLADQYPRFVGLTGSQEQVTAAKAAFRVFSHKGADPADANGYAVPHSAITYLVDPEGNYVDHFMDVADAQEIASRLQEKLGAA
jgi:protein SCO1/2